MEKKTLNIDLREERKKGPAGRLRRMGKIPAIIYGHGEPTAISVDEHEFNKKFHTVSENTIINLRTGDHDYDVLVKDYQSDILTGRIKHLDFFEIDRKKLLKTHVPIRLTGTSIGVREGGLLEHLLHDAEVECLPKDMPEEYVLDITNLAEGESIHVHQIPPLAGVKIMHHPDQVVVLVAHAKAVIEPVEVEAAVEAVEVSEETETKEG